MIAAAQIVALAALGFIAVVVAILGDLVGYGGFERSLRFIVATVTTAPLSYLGGLDSSAVSLTGIAVVGVVARFGAEFVGIGSLRGDAARLAAFAAKVAGFALVGILGLAAISDLLDLVDFGILDNPFIGGFGIGYLRIVFVTAPVVALTTAFALWQPPTDPDSDPSTTPLGFTIPRPVAASWVGAKWTLGIGVTCLFVLYLAGTSLEILTNGFGEFRFMLARLLWVIVSSMALRAVDVGTFALISSMSFLQIGDGPHDPNWEWLGVPIVLVAFFLGGRAAARAAKPANVAEALTAGSLIGVIIGGLGVLVTLNTQWLGGGTGIAVGAILVPVLWTIPALAGAWFHARQENLPTGVSGPADPTAGTPLTASTPAASQPAASDPATAPPVAGRWAGDPTGRHQLRWWDGNAWTGHVADGDRTGVDPLV